MSTNDRLAKLEAENEELRARLEKLEPKGPKVEFKPPPHQQIDWTANFTLPRSAIEAMVRTVPDGVVRDVVGDNFARGVAPPKPAETKVIPSEKGWITPAPLESPPGVKIIDQMMDVQDALDKRDLAKKLGVKP